MQTGPNPTAFDEPVELNSKRTCMNPKKLSGLSLALAGTMTLSVSLNAQNAPAEDAVPPAAAAPAARGGGRGGNGWANYVLGSTLAQARTFAAEAAARGNVPLTLAQQGAIAELNNGLAALNQAATDARTALTTAAFGDTLDAAGIKAKADALSKAELAVATARSDAFQKLQATANSLKPGQIQVLVQQGARGGGGRGGGGGAGVNDLQAQVAGGHDFSPKEPVFVKAPEEEAASMIMQPGFHLTPVLSDPFIQEANQIAFDGNGRLFVNEMRGYMQDPADVSRHLPISRISMHVDVNGDGFYDSRGDRHTVFVDGLISPRYVMPLGMNSVVVAETDMPDAYKYTDTDNDGKADKKELFMTGMNGQVGGNIEHQTSGLMWGMDNTMYAVYNAYRIRWSPTGVTREDTGSPLSGQWGATMDNYGKMYSQGGASGLPGYYQLPIHYGSFSGGQLIGLGETFGAPMIGDMQGGVSVMRMADNALRTPTAGAGNDIFRGDRLPADMIGDYFYGEEVARIVRRVRPVNNEGITSMQNVYTGTEFIKGTDPLFRPVDMTTAPDGTMYITDMYRGIIQEATWTGPGVISRAKIEQYQLDRIVDHGRIFRLTYDGIQPDSTKPNMGNETPAQLVTRLSHPNGWWRDTAQQLLVLKQDKSVVPALQNLARTGSQFGRIHALWTLEGLGSIDAAMVREQLKSQDPKLRIQAARLSEGLIKAGDTSLIADVKELAKDSNADVVIQAMLTVRYVKAPDAPAFIQAAMDANKAAGVTTFGTQMLTGGGGGGRGGAGARGGRGAPPAAPGAAAPRAGG